VDFFYWILDQNMTFKECLSLMIGCRLFYDHFCMKRPNEYAVCYFQCQSVYFRHVSIYAIMVYAVC